MRSAIEAAPAQAFGVEAAHRQRVAVDHHEGRHVLRHVALEADHRVRADLARTGARPVRPPTITQSPRCTWPASVALVGQDGVAADLAVVRDVHVGHDPVVVADARDARVLHGAAVEGAELADGVAVADLAARSARRAYFLSCGAAPIGAELEDAVVAADRACGPRSRSAAPMRRALADAHVRRRSIA